MKYALEFGILLFVVLVVGVVIWVDQAEEIEVAHGRCCAPMNKGASLRS